MTKAPLIALLLFPLSARAAVPDMSFTVAMSEPVTVTGCPGNCPRIALDVGGVTRYANFSAGSGTSSLTFTYSPVAGDLDLDGISISSTSIDLNTSGTITDLNGNALSPLTFSAPNTSGLKVNYPSLSMDFVNGRYTLNDTSTTNFSTFLTNTSGTFTRASTATYFDASGVMQTASANTPRFDYEPITHTAKGLLLEEGRTNLLQDSANIGSGAWSTDPGCATHIANATTAPDNSNSASKITYSCPGSRKTQSVVVNATTVTFSVFLKPSTVDNGSRLLIYNSTTATSIATVGIPSLASGGTAYANGWRRYTLTATSGFASGNTLRAYVYTDASNGTVSGSELYAWGAQLEVGTFATSYIPTTTATATRVRDTLSIPTASWYSASAGLLYSQLDLVDLISYHAPAALSAGTTYGAGNGFLTRSVSATTVSAGGNCCSASLNQAHTPNTLFKMAGGYAGTTAVIAAMGAANSSTNNDFTGSGTTHLRLGDLRSMDQWQHLGSGHIAQFSYYPALPATAQIQLLTQ